VSYTTRRLRGNEIEGRDYHYVSREEFDERIARAEFLEWAEVFGNYYGTHRSWLERAYETQSDLVLDIDVQGARQLRNKIAGAVSIFILPPSRQVLEQRLRSRSEDSGAVIARRLREAADEIRNYAEYDYVVVNREVDAAAATLASIVRAERSRRARIEEQVLPILRTFEETEATT
jgi:guanylate kinase